MLTYVYVKYVKNCVIFTYPTQSILQIPSESYSKLCLLCYFKSCLTNTIIKIHVYINMTLNTPSMMSHYLGSKKFNFGTSVKMFSRQQRGGWGSEQHEPKNNSNGNKGNRNIGPCVCLVIYTHIYKPFLASYIIHLP